MSEALRRTTLAPLPGCGMGGFLGPVVSLRSTTGYRRSSLRDVDARCRSFPEAGGFTSCSRWLRSSATTPPDHVSHEIRTPAGVPAMRRHALNPHQSALSPRFLDQTTGTMDRHELESRAPRPTSAALSKGSAAIRKASAAWRITFTCLSRSNPQRAYRISSGI